MPAHRLVTDQDRERIIGLIAKLDLSKPWQVDLKRPTKRRSLGLNSYYWKILSFVADETGNSKDDLHEAFKQMFADDFVVMLGENDACHVKSTARMTREQMNLYIQKVEAFIASELAIVLPADERGRA